MAHKARARATASWSRASWTLGLFALLVAGLGAAVPVLPDHPTAAGYYQFVAGSQRSNPYFYPPVRGHAFHGLGQDVRTPFLSGWDRERDLYSSRYASSALPVPLPVGLAFPVRPFNHPVNHHEPSQRLFGTRGRPAMVPTPYLKFSSHSGSGNVEKGKYVGGSQNALVAFPEPGFYGRSGTSGQESVTLHGQEHGYGYPETATVGFYGKPA